MCQFRPITGHDKRRVRHPGGGRKSLPAIGPDLVMALQALVDHNTRSAPMSPLRWTCKSTRKLAKALAEQGHKVSHTRVAQLLADMDYSLQGILKTLDEASHSDRNNQFRYINRCMMGVEKPNKSVRCVNKVCSIRALCFHKVSAARYIVIKGRHLTTLNMGCRSIATTECPLSNASRYN
jgi:hypothetical protein